MKRFMLMSVCVLTCVAVLAGTASAQRGGRGGSGRGSSSRGMGMGRQGQHPGMGSHNHHPHPWGGSGYAVRRTGRLARPVEVDPGESAPEVEEEAAEAAPEQAAVYGVKITKLNKKGTAAKQGLEVGDIILSYNGTDTPTFETLRDAVQQSSGAVEVIFYNAENEQRESITLYPRNGRIGVSGESVQVE
jgi:membrane-associated protease RseP (regulator of RpoE activity)